MAVLVFLSESLGWGYVELLVEAVFVVEEW